MSSSIKRVTNWRNQPQMDDINRLIAAVEELVESGAQGEQGEAGEDGDNGWTPVFGLEAREDDVVMVVTDFVAGQGTKPVSLIGLYVAQDGLSSDILDAVNVRGMQGLRGEAGLDGENGEGVPMGGDTGQVLAKRSSDSFDTEWVDLPPSGGDNGVESFLELSDTPSDYTGQAGKLVAVNPLEDALEFIDAPSGGGGNGGGVEWETGTFTPVLQTSTGDEITTVNVTQAVGEYAKLGNFVTVSVSVQWRQASDANELFYIGNLPFPVKTGQYTASISSVANRPLPDRTGGTGTIESVYGYVDAFLNAFRFHDRLGRVVALSTTSSTRYGIRATGTYEIEE